MTNLLDILSLILVIAGALNWGSVGLFSFNAVEFLLGGFSFIARAVYIVICASGIWCITMFFKKDETK